ncbi:TPA: hypothetical protein NJ007_002222 [Vibrio parahaemolyticus]|nr:hypothetical protein [Vibrio parahaemolyticus]
MSFATLPKAKLTLQGMSESWEDKYPTNVRYRSISLAGHSFSFRFYSFEY